MTPMLLYAWTPGAPGTQHLSRWDPTPQGVGCEAAGLEAQV